MSWGVGDWSERMLASSGSRSTLYRMPISTKSKLADVAILLAKLYRRMFGCRQEERRQRFLPLDDGWKAPIAVPMGNSKPMLWRIGSDGFPIGSLDE